MSVGWPLHPSGGERRCFHPPSRGLTTTGIPLQSGNYGEIAKTLLSTLGATGWSANPCPRGRRRHGLADQPVAPGPSPGRSQEVTWGRSRWRSARSAEIFGAPAPPDGRDFPIGSRWMRLRKTQERSGETTMQDKTPTSKPTPHLAPAFAAVILSVIAGWSCSVPMPEFRKLGRSRRSRRIRPSSNGAGIAPAQEPGHGFAAGGPGYRLSAADLRKLGVDPAGGLQSPFPCDQPVPRSADGVHDFPGRQGGDDLLDHPAEAGRGRPVLRAESWSSPCRLIVTCWEG